ncbi:hypothetical protein H6P81_021421 [Aristolochia fimbriata]|uniref:Uncharacterized protein n=1 Tax=Aristolochia fimbriata TaxID=158543 RepID=A0AAV7DQ07_ARIFI|nr:hypothetical protein H6P81_021421 [Aristolochia fimbriata]
MSALPIIVKQNSPKSKLDRRHRRPPACRPTLGAFRLPRARCRGGGPLAGLVGGGALKHNSDRRFESFAGDLNLRRGIVSGRVALLPRSTEFSPPCRTDSSLPSRARAVGPKHIKENKNVERRGFPTFGAAVAVPSHPRQPAGLLSQRESSQVPVVLGAKRGGGAGARPRRQEALTGAEARGHSRHAKGKRRQALDSDKKKKVLVAAPGTEGKAEPR